MSMCFCIREVRLKHFLITPFHEAEQVSTSADSTIFEYVEERCELLRDGLLLSLLPPVLPEKSTHLGMKSQ